MYYLKNSESAASPSHDQNLELFELLETAKCRISELQANASAHPSELKQWERTAEKAREQLILANLGLVASVAKRYTKFDQDIEELVSAGTIGLIKAIEGFDHRLGNQLSTYATWWIRQSITRSPMMQATIRIPEGRLPEIRKVKELIDELTTEYGRKPSAADIANVMGISLEKAYDLLVSSALSVVPIDAPIGDTDGFSHGDYIQDTTASDPREAADFADMMELVDEAAETLAGLEREIFLMFKNDPGLALEQIGKTIGRSGERVRQIKVAAIDKVRAYLVTKNRKVPAKVFKVVVPDAGKQTAAPVGKGKGFRLKMRAVEKNPNHHIWNNNGTWYCDFTLITDSGKKNRVRNSLSTDNVEDARRRRDKFILLYNGPSDTAA